MIYEPRLEKVKALCLSNGQVKELSIRSKDKRNDGFMAIDSAPID